MVFPASTPSDFLTVVLRECGERTADASFKLLNEVFAEQDIHRVKETPFSRALRESMLIGLRDGREWTLCIDADVLVLRDGLLELLEGAKLQKEDVFEIQGMVLDHLFGLNRPAGNHLFRTRYLGEAMGLIPEEGTALRPEHEMIREMRKRGRWDVQIPTVVGLHDFEQQYDDIYRKCFLQAHKHYWLENFLLSRWERLGAEGERDYKVAAQAYRDGKDYKGMVLVDKGFESGSISARLDELGVVSKGDLNSRQFDDSTVGNLVNDFLSGVTGTERREQAIVVDHFFAQPALKVQRNSLRNALNRLGFAAIDLLKVKQK